MDTNTEHDSSVIDMQVIQSLRELGGDDDPGLLVELIDIFLEDAPQRLRDVSEALAADDLRRLERAAHTLKSSSANLGALGLSKLCKEMEEIVRGNTTQGVADLLAQSSRRLGEVETALRALRS